MSSGAAKIFDIQAGICAAILLTSVPMYFFGKKYRWFWCRYNLIKVFRLETDHAGAEG
jgi:hypothetical protein